MGQSYHDQATRSGPLDPIDAVYSAQRIAASGFSRNNAREKAGSDTGISTGAV